MVTGHRHVKRPSVFKSLRWCGTLLGEGKLIIFLLYSLSSGLAAVQDISGPVILMAPSSLLFHERWPITLDTEINVLSIDCKHINRKNHQSRGEIEHLLGLAWSMH